MVRPAARKLVCNLMYARAHDVESWFWVATLPIFNRYQYVSILCGVGTPAFQISEPKHVGGPYSTTREDSVGYKRSPEVRELQKVVSGCSGAHKLPMQPWFAARNSSNGGYSKSCDRTLANHIMKGNT